MRIESQEIRRTDPETHHGAIVEETRNAGSPEYDEAVGVGVDEGTESEVTWGSLSLRVCLDGDPRPDAGVTSDK